MAEVSGSRARELAGVIRYAMYAAFRVRRESGGLPEHARGAAAAEARGLCEQAAGAGIVTRGAYQVSGYRPDADYLFWWIADCPDDLQDLYCRFLRTRLGHAVAAVMPPASVLLSFLAAVPAGLCGCGVVLAWASRLGVADPTADPVAWRM